MATSKKPYLRPPRRVNTGYRGWQGGAGAARHPISIQVNTPTRAADGGLKDSWTTVLDCMADIAPLTVYETLLVAQQRETFDTQYIIRYPPGLAIAPGMRLLDGGDAFIIYEPTDRDGTLRELWLRCRSVKALADGGEA